MKKLNEILKSKYSRVVLVIVFLIIFILTTIIVQRGTFLEYKELGEEYIHIFAVNLKCKYIIMSISFVIIYIMVYFINRGIKKGIKPFLEQDNIKIPNFLNKSLALIIALIGSTIVSNVLQEKILMLISNVKFGITEPIFNLDISYYMFIKPLIEAGIQLFMTFVIWSSIYMSAYYIIIFSLYCNGVDRELLKKSLLFKKLQRNVILIAIGIAANTLMNTQNIVLEPFLKLKNEAETELIGAGFIESTIKLVGYQIFSVIVVIVAVLGIKYFKKEQAKKVLVRLAIIPSYLIVFFLIVQGFDYIYIRSNELDKEWKYISKNIEFTKKAYNLEISEENLDYSGIIKLEEIEDNPQVIGNIPLVSEVMVKNTLEDTQTQKGYYTYKNIALAKYNISGNDKLVYVSPREISSRSVTYNYKTYEYTHGLGEIIVSATDTTDTGTIQYIQKDIEGNDNAIKISQPRIYFGLETNETIVTNSKNKEEYDYTDSDGKQYTFEYTGKAGLKLGFFDRFLLGTKQGDLKLAFSTSVDNESKILINRNIRERAKKALPYLMYDENPYTVIDNNGDIYWVLDAYTASSEYPYSTYTEIEYEGEKQKINYIRNSVKVIINAYDGTMKFYITDRTDPIAIAYNKLYPNLFEDKESEIPEDISSKFIYPKFLYDVQAKMLEVYHNVKPEVLYRSNDLWEFATYNTNQTNKTVGTILESYYTMLKTTDSDTEKLGLVQMYTKDGKSNITSYLVGECEGINTKLSIYKFSTDTNLLGPTQLDKQIEQDETISKQLNSLNITGSRISKKIIIVPIENTLLYIEPIYQTMINESNVPSLKKVIVASGTKMAIGDNIIEALENLLSQYALNIQIDRTDDIEGMIKSIIEANNNLKASSESHNWEIMGRDIQELQELIDILEKLIDEKEKNNETKSTEQVDSLENK